MWASGIVWIILLETVTSVSGSRDTQKELHWSHPNFKYQADPCPVGSALTPTTDRCDTYLSCGVVTSCPYPLLFSTQTDRCESFRDVHCGSRRSPITPGEYLHSNCLVNGTRCMCDGKTNLDYNFCLSRASGFYTWPGRKWSPYYIRCDEGRAFPLECSGASVIFDFIRKECNIIYDVVNNVYHISYVLQAFTSSQTQLGASPSLITTSYPDLSLKAESIGHSGSSSLLNTNALHILPSMSISSGNESAFSTTLQTAITLLPHPPSSLYLQTTMSFNTMDILPSFNIVQTSLFSTTALQESTTVYLSKTNTAFSGSFVNYSLDISTHGLSTISSNLSTKSNNVRSTPVLQRSTTSFKLTQLSSTPEANLKSEIPSTEINSNGLSKMVTTLSPFSELTPSLDTRTHDKVSSASEYATKVEIAPHTESKPIVSTTPPRPTSQQPQTVSPAIESILFSSNADLRPRSISSSVVTLHLASTSDYTAMTTRSEHVNHVTSSSRTSIPSSPHTTTLSESEYITVGPTLTLGNTTGRLSITEIASLKQTPSVSVVYVNSTPSLNQTQSVSVVCVNSTPSLKQTPSVSVVYVSSTSVNINLASSTKAGISLASVGMSTVPLPFTESMLSSRHTEQVSTVFVTSTDGSPIVESTISHHLKPDSTMFVASIDNGTTALYLSSFLVHGQTTYIAAPVSSNVNSQTPHVASSTKVTPVSTVVASVTSPTTSPSKQTVDRSEYGTVLAKSTEDLLIGTLSTASGQTPLISASLVGNSDHSILTGYSVSSQQTMLSHSPISSTFRSPSLQGSTFSFYDSLAHPSVTSDSFISERSLLSSGQQQSFVSDAFESHSVDYHSVTHNSSLQHLPHSPLVLLTSFDASSVSMQRPHSKHVISTSSVLGTNSNTLFSTKMADNSKQTTPHSSTNDETSTADLTSKTHTFTSTIDATRTHTSQASPTVDSSNTVYISSFHHTTMIVPPVASTSSAKSYEMTHPAISQDTYVVTQPMVNTGRSHSTTLIGSYLTTIAPTRLSIINSMALSSTARLSNSANIPITITRSHFVPQLVSSEYSPLVPVVFVPATTASFSTAQLTHEPYVSTVTAPEVTRTQIETLTSSQGIASISSNDLKHGNSTTRNIPIEASASTVRLSSLDKLDQTSVYTSSPSLGFHSTTTTASSMSVIRSEHQHSAPQITVSVDSVSSFIDSDVLVHSSQEVSISNKPSSNDLHRSSFITVSSEVSLKPEKGQSSSEHDIAESSTVKYSSGTVIAPSTATLNGNSVESFYSHFYGPAVVSSRNFGELESSIGESTRRHNLESSSHLPNVFPTSSLVTRFDKTTRLSHYVSSVVIAASETTKSVDLSSTPKFPSLSKLSVSASNNGVIPNTKLHHSDDASIKRTTDLSVNVSSTPTHLHGSENSKRTLYLSEPMSVSDIMMTSVVFSNPFPMLASSDIPSVTSQMNISPAAIVTRVSPASSLNHLTSASISRDLTKTRLVQSTSFLLPSSYTRSPINVDFKSETTSQPKSLPSSTFKLRPSKQTYTTVSTKSTQTKRSSLHPLHTTTMSSVRHSETTTSADGVGSSSKNRNLAPILGGAIGGFIVLIIIFAIVLIRCKTQSGSQDFGKYRTN